MRMVRRLMRGLGSRLSGLVVVRGVTIDAIDEIDEIGEIGEIGDYYYVSKKSSSTSRVENHQQKEYSSSEIYHYSN